MEHKEGKKEQPILSILICTMPERIMKFDRLLAEIYRQRQEQNVEVIFNSSNRGVRTIGEKRNELKNAANGKYLAYLDDDDMINPHYLQLLVEGCKTVNSDADGYDLISFDFNYFVDGKYDKTIIMNRFIGNDWCNKHWAQNYNPTHRFTKKGIHFHLCAVKSELANQVSFPDANNAEDIGYSDSLMPLIQSEFHIEHALLNVYFSTTKIQNI